MKRAAQRAKPSLGHSVNDARSWLGGCSDDRSSGVSQLAGPGMSAMDAVRDFSLPDAGIGLPLTRPALMGLLRDWF